jgi:hypothetical protein
VGIVGIWISRISPTIRLAEFPCMAGVTITVAISSLFPVFSQADNNNIERKTIEIIGTLVLINIPLH